MKIDVDSMTNSVVMAMEKEFRKTGMGGSFHRHESLNRALIRGMVAMITADHYANPVKVPKRTKTKKPSAEQHAR